VVSNHLRELVKNQTVMVQEAVERVIPTNLRVNPLYIQVGHIIPTNLRVNPLYIQVGHILYAHQP
jgi:hypothetical protein